MPQLPLFEGHRPKEAEMSISGKVPAGHAIEMGEPVYVLVKAFCGYVGHGFIGNPKSAEEAKQKAVNRGDKLIVEQARIIEYDQGKKLMSELKAVKPPPPLSLKEIAGRAMALDGVDGARVVDADTPFVEVFIGGDPKGFEVKDESDLKHLERDILPAQMGQMAREAMS